MAGPGWCNQLHHLPGVAQHPASCPHPGCHLLRAVGEPYMRSEEGVRGLPLTAYLPGFGCKAWRLVTAKGGWQLGRAK